MKIAAILAVLGILGALTFASQHGQHPQPTGSTAVSGGGRHASMGFELTVRAPYQQAFALFGPHGERLWGGEDWNPQFVYPQPEEDKEGAVFIVSLGGHTIPWVMTIYDPERGRIQYTFTLRDVVTVIDINAAAADAANTKVKVTYSWTALKPEENERVQKSAEAHKGLGPHWEAEINGALEKAKQPK
ncbi:MAG TPA: hypothetical protein VEW69_07375 [Alphaproteobacteria bacterium]|nr:hypothetical protein [Alphaproteobacteria bacterium]